MQAFPGEVALEIIGATPFTSVGTLSTGIPLIPDPVGNNGAFVVPPATGNLSAMLANDEYVRGYTQSYNFTVQKELPAGFVGQVGYVGSHSLKLQTQLNINYGLLGGGGASQLLFPHGNLTNVNVLAPYGSGIYNSLQATLNRRLSGGLTFQSAYTYSKHIEMLTSVLIPEYLSMNRAKSGADRTHHYVLSGTYELPFGRGKQMAQGGVGAAILGGWA
jgi:hypothetical protein